MDESTTNVIPAVLIGSILAIIVVVSLVTQSIEKRQEDLARQTSGMRYGNTELRKEIGDTRGRIASKQTSLASRMRVLHIAEHELDQRLAARSAELATTRDRSDRARLRARCADQASEILAGLDREDPTLQRMLSDTVAELASFATIKERYDTARRNFFPAEQMIWQNAGRTKRENLHANRRRLQSLIESSIARSKAELHRLKWPDTADRAIFDARAARWREHWVTRVEQQIDKRVAALSTDWIDETRH